MRRTRLPLVVALAVVLVAALALAATGSAKRQETIKAAWIYVGPHNDGGWSQAHDAGRLYVQKKLGAKVETTFKENVPEGPQFQQVLDSLIRDGNKIIFATSFGFQKYMKPTAAKNPDLYFEQATGIGTGKNYAVYFGAGEDAIYLSGIAAGAATKSGVIGYVVPFAIPEVIRHANAFMLGVQKVRPDAKLKLVWTNSWFDPAKEKKAAESLVAAGADVLAQNVDSPATGQVAQAKGVKWVGYDSDASKFAPKAWLTAAVYNWGPYYLKKVQAAMNGTWKTNDYYGSIADGFTDIAPFGATVSAKTKALIAAERKKLIAKPMSEFTGPIKDQAGKVRIPAGKQATLVELLTMNWLAQGIEGSATGK
ncbi:MAG: BMP family ABC transporter substrate-binding protein [Actinobacteria bacterium]|nr:BMP family ABC transporter substrate-binding protein [Actinomycetota bacterium]